MRVFTLKATNVFISRKMFERDRVLYDCVWNTVWKLQKSTLTHFWQKFRESNGLTKEITKYVHSSFDEIFFQ